MSWEYEAWLSSPYGQRRFHFDELLYLDYERQVNEITPLTLRVPADGVPWSWLSRDARIDIWASVDGGPLRREADTTWLLRGRKKTRSGRKRMIEVRCLTANSLLAGRDVAYAAGSTQASKSGPADDLMHAIVRENLGSLAMNTARDLSAYLEVAPDRSLGPAVERQFARRNVYLVLRDLADEAAYLGTPIYFDIANDSDRLRFYTYIGARGVDRTSGNVPLVVFSPELGTITDAEYEENYEYESTVVYGVGRGLLDRRLVEMVQDDERIGLSPFNWRETTIDARNVSTSAAVLAEASTALNFGRPCLHFDGAIGGTTRDYGKRWGWGDKVRAEFEGDVIDCRVDQVHVRVEAGRRVVKASLATDALL